MSAHLQKKNWDILPLSTLCNFQNGYAFKNKDFQQSPEEAYIVFKMGHIERGGGLKQGAKCSFIAREKCTSLERFVLNKGDLAMSMTDMKASMALLGHTALVDQSNRYILNQRVGRITVRNKKLLDGKFLFYYSNSKDYISYLRGVAHSGVQVNLSTKAIVESPILLPDINTQRKIASILSAYDDLIENNLRRIKILEEMAQNLYREWFVKFRFPGHEKVKFVDSPLGKIPEGWEVTTLDEQCILTMGQSPKSEFYNKDGDGLPFHQGVSNFGDRFPIDKLYCTVNNRIALRGDILFSVRAPVGRINMAIRKIVIGRGLSAIRHKGGAQWFLLRALKAIFKNEDMIGGGTIFKSVTKSDMQNVKLIVPDSSLLSDFQRIVSPVEELINTLTESNYNLRQTRDLLLPKLISGKLDVSDLDIKIPEETA